MELWFWLALASALTGGFGAFTHKVAAEGKHDIAVLSVYASAFSASLLLACTLIFTDSLSLWQLSTLFAFLGATTYLVTLILKVASLSVIDSAIFFPLYKVSGPLLGIFFGVIFFAESLSLYEWFGLMLSIFVPLLLITKAENGRQKNLRKGIYLLLIASLIGATSVAFIKYGTDITQNVWLYLFVTDVFMMFSAVLLLLKRHKRTVIKSIKKESSVSALRLAVIMGALQAVAGATMVFAFAAGGYLSIVYTINSLYILIPIILSIIFYNEHWNARKAVAIFLSVAALALLK